MGSGREEGAEWDDETGDDRIRHLQGTPDDEPGLNALACWSTYQTLCKPPPVREYVPDLTKYAVCTGLAQQEDGLSRRIQPVAHTLHSTTPFLFAHSASD